MTSKQYIELWQSFRGDDDLWLAMQNYACAFVNWCETHYFRKVDSVHWICRPENQSWPSAGEYVYKTFVLGDLIRLFEESDWEKID